MNTAKLVILENNNIGWLVKSSHGNKQETYTYYGWFAGMSVKGNLSDSHKRAIKADKFNLDNIKYNLEHNIVI